MKFQINRNTKFTEFTITNIKFPFRISRRIYEHISTTKAYLKVSSVIKRIRSKLSTASDYLFRKQFKNSSPIMIFIKLSTQLIMMLLVFYDDGSMIRALLIIGVIESNAVSLAKNKAMTKNVPNMHFRASMIALKGNEVN